MGEIVEARAVRKGRPMVHVRPMPRRDPHYAAVPKLWPGCTMVCIGSGPSLTPEDVNYCRDKARVIVINNGYQLAPWADCLYAADGSWIREHQGAPSFHGFKYTLSREAGTYRDLGWKLLHETGNKGIDLHPSNLRTGRHSGYQAMHLAVHFGATRIVLLGYDLTRGPKGQEHWHPDHRTRVQSNYPLYVQCLETIVQPLKELGIHVINCSRVTKIPYFERSTIQAVLG